MLKFIKLGTAVKADDLASLAYQLKGNTSAAALTAASEALLLANPALRAKKRIDEGTVVLVPDIGGRLPPAKEAEPVEIPLGKIGLLADKQVASLAAEASAAAGAAKESAAATAALLKSSARKLIAEQAPGAEEQLDAILEAAKARAERVQQREKVLRKVFDRMAEDLKRLRVRS
jgi:hypothetical protein